MMKAVRISKPFIETTMVSVKQITVANCPTLKKTVMTMLTTMEKTKNECPVLMDEGCPYLEKWYGNGKIEYTCSRPDPTDCEYYVFYNEDEIGG